ncbi:DUF1700 domain-containing protein [Enterocloster bolteae]|jgi:hypothetical protein|uniref:DUF1700 domain-containing protein n=4 Tax=Enterocloster bolteae TaxID=208479 RepID=R0BQ36_9FIRM|nr:MULTISPECIES: DUF1700 domain-containing protein [Enterocloster]ENZ16196.1 hypothetical protein HMPREF1082_00690 [[Clostridium] clostridioforme 90A7]RGB89029.1 DUF1700 domain-containing protein [Enterocloster clostridioformis]RGB99843.1 DUF1700 domain-containing protein [Hungatella hathewayi]CCX98465.1 putative uncharacterized protein [Enterocloster bolteae CAG:59]ASN94061.1 DUF1700 domain-containing protein [Enterocloster bolteae]
MSRTEFLQGLKSELEGRVPYSVIQENLRYYDSYIMEEAAKGQTEDEVIESLGGPRIIARTIVDAALDTEDRPDGFDSFESEASYRSGPAGSSQEEREPFRGKKPEVHYVDFGKWYVRLIAGLVVFLVIFLVMTVFFGIMGLAGWILSYIWPVLLVMLAVWMFRGPRR